MGWIRKRIATGRDERGAALLTAILITVFVFSAVMAIAGSSLLSVQITSNSRGSLKAFTAAEAGRDVAAVGLTRGACTRTATTTTEPRYTYRVYNYRSRNGETPTGLNNRTAYGCPSVFSTHAIVVSTGFDGKGSQKTVTSVYRWHPTGSSPLNASIASGSDLPLSNTAVLLPEGSTTPGDVVVSTGSFRCLGSQTKVMGSVYVLQGNADLGGCSTINGNVSAGVGTDQYGNQVGGNVTFGGSGRVVDGNVCAMRSIQHMKTGQVGGTVRQYQASCPGLDNAAWQDYNPPMDGAEVLTGTQCTRISQIAAAAVTPVILDARQCGIDVVVTSAVLQTDVTIVARSFKVNNAQFTSADGLGYMFNLISPDYFKTTPSQRHCSTSQSSSSFQQLNMRPPMMGLIYTPCTITHVTGTWSGQVYGGAVQSNFAAGEIYYIPTPAPGVGVDGVVGYAIPVPVYQAE